MSEATDRLPEADPVIPPGLSRGPGHGHPRPWLAALVGLLIPGLGHLYARAPGRGLAVGALFTFALGPIGSYVVGFLSGSRAGMLAGVGCVVLVALLINPVDAWRVARQRRSRTRWNRWWIYVAYAVLLVVVAPPARRAMAEFERFRTLTVPSSAMSDTLLPGDYLLCDTGSFDPSSARRGDIVIYRRRTEPQEFMVPVWKPGPDGSRGEMAHEFEVRPAEVIWMVGRLIGLPGEVVELDESRLYVDGSPVDEPYVPERALVTSSPGDFGPFPVPEGAYFILGDHRNRSYDSREFGAIAEDDMIGHVRIVLFSIEQQFRPGGSASSVRWNRIGARPDTPN